MDRTERIVILVSEAEKALLKEASGGSRSLGPMLRTVGLEHAQRMLGWAKLSPLEEAPLL